jgi:hypothetical protein
MKRLAAAGTFALLAGAFGLLLLASIVFSCQQGGQPHEMGADADSAMQTHPPQETVAAPQPAERVVPTALNDRPA